MKKKLLACSAILCAMVAIPFAVKSADTAPASQSMHGMMHGDMQGMMDKAHASLSEDAKLRVKMLMNVEVSRNDPNAMLALKDTLKLTDDQVKQLDGILAEARQKAQAVLTDEQKKIIQPLGDEPVSMMKTHQQMMKNMDPKMMTYTCPMHPEVRNAGPGKCPKCGMNLEPMADCPMMGMEGRQSDQMQHSEQEKMKSNG